MQPLTTESWQSLKITVDPSAAEAVEFALNELDSLGTEIDHLRKRSDDAVTVSGYFSERLSDDDVKNALSYALQAYSLPEDTILETAWETIGRTDWLAEWKKHWKPTTVGRFVISPPWQDPEATEKFLIKIEPNMAFGTGTHDTTRLCIDAIDRLYRPDDSFFDVGTGTGILSIAAALIAAKEDPAAAPRITACDTDTDSVAIARENLMLNGVDRLVALYEGSIEETSEAADFVCANLTLDVIEPLLPLLLSKTRRILLLSGILAEQEPVILRALSDDQYPDAKVTRSGEWISVIVEV